MTDTTRLAALMAADTDAYLEYKTAKAHAFLAALEAGDRQTEIWQRIAADPKLIRLEREHLEARAARTVAWIEVTQTGDGTDDESPDGV